MNTLSFFIRPIALFGFLLLSAQNGWNRCPEYVQNKRPLFGDLHVHTSFSLDAYGLGVRNDPSDAYKFAKKRGVIGLTPNGGSLSNPKPSRSLEIDRALDFAAVTDHGEFVSALRVLPCSYDPQNCPANYDSAWERTKAAAHAAYVPCTFTSFVGYEYTLGGDGVSNPMEHRNVIFANENVLDQPAHALAYPTPAQLWAKLLASCTLSARGCSVLTIAHNPNYSWGTYFETVTDGGRPITAREANLRATFEPLVEMIQHKGSSECRYNVGNNDEECNFELDEGRGTVDSVRDGAAYIRQGLKTGLQQYNLLGVNPFKLGFIGSTDTHNGTPGAVSESRWMGHAGDADDNARKLINFPPGTNPGGLAVVWAEENTRTSIFNALRRRETYATSGPRMIVRMFGGFDYPANICTQANLVDTGYAKGVPMGGNLSIDGSNYIGGDLPKFIVSVLQDPDSRRDSSLQRIEIIKGWVDAQGATQERVYVVAGQRNNGNTVDPATCTQSGPGYSSLCVLWTDSSFHSDSAAFYYARVFEIPSCHWSQYLTNDSLVRHPDSLPRFIQERAWTSPIWYEPANQQRSNLGKHRPGKARLGSSMDIFTTSQKLLVKLHDFKNPSHANLLDGQGRILKRIPLESRAKELALDKGKWPEGSYVLQVFHAGKTQSKRFFW